MRKIWVIGIGTGNPDHLTLQAVRALGQLDVVFVLDKGREKADLLGLRKLICERYIRDKPYRVVELADPVRDPSIADYNERVERWHEQRAQLYEDALAAELGEHESAGILAWGDPSLYDSTLRLLERLQRRAAVPFEYAVIPGITSVAALAASHRITLQRIGGSLLITTGRKLAERGFPADIDDVVVMLDGECAFRHVASAGLQIYWGAYLGSPDEIVLSGALSEVCERLIALRSAARERHGWIMDIYLLRRHSQRGSA
jgi:precorrin-6A synthase